MATGTVKWWETEKGWGYIAQDERGDDVYVHYTAIKGTTYRQLEADWRVEYSVTEGRTEHGETGLTAFDVTVLSGPPAAPAPAPQPPPAPPAAPPLPASSGIPGADTREGTVKSFDGMTGYGVIAPDNGGPDVVVHASDIQGDGEIKTLEKDQRVKFEVSPRAVNVRTL